MSVSDLILNHSDIIFDEKKSAAQLLFELQQDIVEEDDDECEYLSQEYLSYLYRKDTKFFEMFIEP